MHPLIYDWNTVDAPRRPIAAGDARRRDAARRAAVAVGADADDRRRRSGSCTSWTRSASTPPTSACRAPARTSSRDVERLAREIVDARSCASRANCAARTVVADIEPIVDISQRTGLAIECCTFIGSSPIRQYAEDWTLDQLAATDRGGGQRSRVSEGLPVMYVTEDTTRADPESLRRAVLDRDPRRARRASASPTRSATRRRPARAPSCASCSDRRRVRRRRRHRLARPPRPRSGDREQPGRDRGRRDARARRGARHRRARRQHADGPAARQPRAAGLARGRPHALPEYCASCPRPAACRFRRTIRSSAATRFAPPPACTPRP